MAVMACPSNPYCSPISSKVGYCNQNSRLVRKAFLDGRTEFPNLRKQLFQNQGKHLPSRTLPATMNNPKGFGTSPKKVEKPNKFKPRKDDKEEDSEEDEYPDAGVIPEVVTNRMISRMAFTVGIPLFVGLLFFPFFYYLKVVLKIDVPNWVPFGVSFIFFGTALLGVSYGIVSSSWDPLREGSLLGWIEAQKNWPVFWQSIRGRPDKRCNPMQEYVLNPEGKNINRILCYKCKTRLSVV